MIGKTIITQKARSGRFSWERYTTTGTFLDFIISDNIYDYPADGTQDGYQYKLIDTSIENLTWQEIHDIAYAGDAPTILPLGTQKTITLTTNEVITMEVADFNHDTLQDGTIAPISFIMKDCFSTIYQMNNIMTNAGGWKDSALRTTLNNTILNTFPSDLKSLIKYTKKQRFNGGKDTTTLNTIYDKLWIPSEIELFGTYAYTGANGEGTQYPIFTDNTSRIKYQKNISAIEYWTSSAIGTITINFVYVTPEGKTSHYNYVTTDRGVAAGFCI